MLKSWRINSSSLLLLPFDWWQGATSGDVGWENLSGKGNVLSSLITVMLDKIFAVCPFPLTALHCPQHRVSVEVT